MIVGSRRYEPQLNPTYLDPLNARPFKKLPGSRRSLFESNASSSMAAAPAFAQLEEIIVTATRHEESLQDVPVSVTALTGAALQEAGFSDMDDLSIFISNLYMRDTLTR